MYGEQLRQLTGCRYAVILSLERGLGQSLAKIGRGAPLRRSVRTILVAALVKLRGNDAYRTLAIHLKIPHVTLHRYTLRICALLAGRSLRPEGLTGHGWLIVDSTCSRVRSMEQADYSGYKHHRSRKVQVIVDDLWRIVDVSKAYSGAVHDKVIWNRESGRVRASLDRPTLGDKAYAGGEGEGTILFRPIKRNETAYKADVDGCKTANRQLSKVRVKVEHVFARLKTFRVLQGLFVFRPERYAMVFHAVAVIYNEILQEKYARKFG